MTDLLGPFSRLVEELLEDHLTDDNEPEGALLPMLYDAIGSSTGAGSAPGGSTRASAPLDLGALDLWDSIAKEIRQNAPDVGSEVFSEMDLLKLWIAESHDNLMLQIELMERMVVWRNDIVEKFNPPKIVAMRRVDCPMCKATKDAEGIEPINLHCPKNCTPYAECTNCGYRWAGGHLLDLRALIK